MPPRNSRKAPCHNCPKPVASKPAAMPKAVIPPPPPKRGRGQLPPSVLSAAAPAKSDVTTEDGLKLWRHVLFGANTCLDMIDGYAKLEMPGDPTEGLTFLRDRLNKTIQLLKDRANAVSVPAV